MNHCFISSTVCNGNYIKQFTFLFVLFVVTEVPCIKKTFVEPVPNKILVSHVISTLTVASEEVCKIHCFIEVSCVSYNFGPKETGYHVCELSESDAISHPLDWITKQGFLYGETQVWKVW